MRHRPALATVALSAAALAAAAGTAAALPAQWTPAERYDTATTNGRALAMSAAGEAVFATSLDGPAQGEFVFVASIRRPDGTWGPRRTLTNSGTSTGRPKAAMAPDGTAVVVWHELSPGGFERVRALWRVPGGDWELLPETVSATGDGAEVGSPSVAIDDGGRAIVTWAQGASFAASRALVREGTRLGWAPVDQLSPPTVGALSVQAVVDASGAAVAAWRQSAAGAAGAWSSARAPGAAWPDPATATQITTTADGLTLAGAPDGRVIVGWATDPPSGTKEAYVRTRQGGAWGTATTLSAQLAMDSSTPVVDVDATGRQLAVWRQATAGDDTGWVAVREPGAAGWSTPAPVTADAGDPVYGALGILTGTGEAVVLWDGPLGSTGVLRVPPGASPGDPVPVESYGRGFAATTDGAGAVGVSFTDSGTWTSVIDTTPPALSVTQAPAAGTTGELLTFQAAASDPWSGATLAWDHGDGTTAAGPATTHAFTAPGAFAVVARATDGVGNAATATVPVQVSAPAAPPAPPAGVPAVTTGAGGPPPATTTLAPGPLVRGVKVLGRPSATVRLRVRVTTARAGTVRLLLQRRTRTGFRTVARVRRTLAAGTTVVRLAGRAAGRYRVVVVAEGTRTPAAFRVRPRVP